MMDIIKYTINESRSSDIEEHLIKCSENFVPSLDSYVDIPSYAIKLEKFADTFEAWYKSELICLIACYLNDRERGDGFITNVSTIKHFQGKGIARKILVDLFNYATQKNFNTLSLEVHKNNLKAIDFYTKIGFHKVNQTKKNNSNLMFMALKQENNVSTNC